MKCACCGKSRKFFESYAPLGEDMNVCIKCDTVLCRIKDAGKDGQKEQYDENVGIVKANIRKTKNEEFSTWFDGYLKKLNASYGREMAAHNREDGL